MLLSRGEIDLGVPFLVKGCRAPVRCRFELLGLKTSADFFDSTMSAEALEGTFLRGRGCPEVPGGEQVRADLMGLVPMGPASVARGQDL